jgi:hypothetical protein
MPNGIVMMNMHITMPAIAYAMKNQIPERTSQRRFRMIRTARVSHGDTFERGTNLSADADSAVGVTPFGPNSLLGGGVMEDRDITALAGELAEDARVLDACLQQHDPQQLGSVVISLRERASSLYEILENGPRPWRNAYGDAYGGAWVAMTSAAHLEEHLAQSELDWCDIGAAVSFAVSGVEQLAAKWSEMLETLGTEEAP